MSGKKELLVQRHIKDSVRKDGGFAVKLSHKFAVGVVDLLIAYPPYTPVVAEVKDLATCIDKFSRKIETTDAQYEFMERISKPYEELGEQYNMRMCCAFTLIALQHRGEYRLIAAPRWAEQMTYQYEDTLPWVTRQTGCYYPLRELLEGVKAMKWRM